MSKESFSKSLASEMLDRFSHLDNLVLLESNDSFKLALALAYMTLSKESIIKKDFTNKDRKDTNRLQRRVATSDIDHLFERCRGIDIIYSDVWDNTWILDTIRDSILHEHFDIDEETRSIFISNPMYGKKLEAIISFDWFYRYIIDDILSKRITDHFTTKSFYYNNFGDVFSHPSMRPNKKYRRENRNFAVNNHILYKVDIVGEKIPVEKMEQLISLLFLEYSKEEVTEEDILKYQDQIPSKKNMYPMLYLVSFLKARDRVIEDLKRDFPDYQINISIDERKRKLIEKSHNKISRSIDNYDDLFKQLNDLLAKRTKTQLNAIAHIYDYIEVNHPASDGYYTDFLDNIIKLVHGEDYAESNDSSVHREEIFKARDMLLDTLIQVYGLAILSINKSSLSNDQSMSYITGKTEYFNSKSYQRFATKRRKLMSDSLDYLFKISEVEEQLKNCPDKIKNMLEDKKKDYNEKLRDTLDELDELEKQMKLYPKDKKKAGYAKKVTNQLNETIEKYIVHFKNTPYQSMSGSVRSKTAIKCIILELLDQLTELEDKYYFCPCSSKEALEIIRNSFSHIGRVKANLYSNELTLFDFDNNGNYAGVVHTGLVGFVHFLSTCLDQNEGLKTQVSEVGKVK